MYKSAFFSLFIVLSVFLPSVSSAYFTTAQHAVSVDGSLGLYTIEFKFGHGTRDVSIPVIAQPGRTKSDQALTYQIINNDNERARGMTAGIVLSNAIVDDGMYFVPKGETATFTLVTFFTPDADEEGTDFRAQVTNLPFMFNGVQTLSLNPSELKAYTTELLPLVHK